jgi:nicotinate-nucleotide adenylyltransferase
MRIGIFGGTFDPPHIGHQILAAEALEQLKLDQIFWVLTPFPPHKIQQKITTLTHRLRMVELAIESNLKFILSRVDIDRQPPHYAVDTMSILRKQAPDDEFYYLMGMDSLYDLPAWHCPTDFVDLCNGIVVMVRQGEILETSKLDNEIIGLDSKLHYLKTPIIEISASDIRTRIGDGKQYRYFVPEKVYQYIVNNHLYKN